MAYLNIFKEFVRVENTISKYTRERERERERERDWKNKMFFIFVVCFCNGFYYFQF